MITKNDSETQQICKNCKYWKKTNSYPSIILGNCKKVKMFWQCSEWVDKGDDIVRELNGKHKEDKAFVQDASDYAAYLITKEEFGCNQYEPTLKT